MTGVMAAPIELRSAEGFDDRISFEIWRGTTLIGLGDIWIGDGSIGGSGPWLDRDSDVHEVERLAEQLAASMGIPIAEEGEEDE